MIFCIEIPIGSIIRYIGINGFFQVIGTLEYTDDIIIISIPKGL